MDNFKYVNAGQSTLASSIAAADTSLTVANAARFPSSLSGGEILVLTLHPSGLESTQEIVLCTSIAAGVMTVTRGAQGTTAQDWPSGTVVGAYLTGEMLGQIRDAVLPITGTNTGDETATRIGAIVNDATAKTAPVDADLLALADSAASSVVKKLSWANAKATLKTYFDTLYNKYVHPNHSGDVTSVADGATTIAANAVSNTKLSDMANATIKGRLTAGAGDPEDLTATQVRTLINVENGAQKNSDILKSEIEAKLTGTDITTHGHSSEISAAIDALSSFSAAKFLHVRDEKASGTAGGTSSSATWHTRDLNTSKTNTISGASLASNKITLPSGTYFIQATAPVYQSNKTSLALYDTTGAAYIIHGQSEYTADGSSSQIQILLSGTFTLAAESALELRHYVQAGKASVGLGTAKALTGIIEAYSEVKIWKL